MVESLGITGIEALHYYVTDLDRSRRFYCGSMDFQELGGSTEDLTEQGRQKSVLFAAGDCRVLASTPIGEGGRASRFLKKHPAGIGTIIFQVSDAKRAFSLLDSRGGTPITEVITAQDDGGTLSHFSISTPFGGTTFRFVERKGYREFFPGFSCYDVPRGGSNKLGLEYFDHITSNFQTMSPALLWMEHVMGWERYWDIEFHTSDVAPGAELGSGLRSQVMWDPTSGVKFANNEPYRPFFKASQINIFNEEHRGDGVQHAAIAIKDIVSGVKAMREKGVEFMPTPGTYYDALTERIQASGIAQIEEEIQVLRDLEILIDGEAHQKYLLQIFLKDAQSLYNDKSAGAFFYEIIQRKGDNGFGGGNFRALFESIEREQTNKGKVA